MIAYVGLSENRISIIYWVIMMIPIQYFYFKYRMFMHFQTRQHEKHHLFAF
jgi:hypothetical protein